MVSTVASQQEGDGFKTSLSVWSVHVVTVSAWVPSGSPTMPEHAVQAYWQLEISHRFEWLFVSICQSCNELVTHPVCVTQCQLGLSPARLQCKV